MNFKAFEAFNWYIIYDKEKNIYFYDKGQNSCYNL